ncbi:MAG: DUF2513 domain-containing protein [Pyrinomonadaceae bacterium]
MKRDMELVRRILLNIEKGNFYGGAEGYHDDAVNFHKALLIDAKLIEGIPRYSSQKPSDIPISVRIKKVTWHGHDFINAIRTDAKWNKIKAFLADRGQDLTIESIQTAAKQLFGPGGLGGSNPA